MAKWLAAVVASAAGMTLTGAALVVPAHARQRNTPGAIHVRTDLVDIFASVMDADGRPVPDLTAGAFQLSEEGVPQKIERFEAQTDRPLDLALMVDSSMSEVQELKFEADAAGRFIQQVVRPHDTLAVFQFSDSVVQLSGFTDRVQELQQAARKIAPGAGTSMYDAVVLGSDALKRLPEGRRRAIVLVTDAGETTSSSSFDEARRTAIASGALLYSIIIRPVKNENGRNTAGEHALITITDSAGGALFILDDIKQLPAMFDRISRELRTQYLLGYYPNPLPPPGSDRHVEVKVKGSYVVHSRTEYFTAGAQR